MTDSKGKSTFSITKVILCVLAALFVAPVVIFTGVMSSVGDADIDSVTDNMSAESQAEMDAIDAVFAEIEAEFSARGLDSVTTEKAELLFLTVLYDVGEMDGFAVTLADCYKKTTTYDTFYTDADGYLITLEPLPAGRYRFVEVEISPFFATSDAIDRVFNIYDGYDTTISGDGGWWIKSYDSATEQQIPRAFSGFQLYDYNSGGEHPLITQDEIYIAETDEEVRQNIVSAFGIEIDAETFTEMMSYVTAET